MGRTLGQGTFAAVHLSKDHRAVKEISYKTDSFGISVVALREMRLMQILQEHINVVRTYGVSLNGDSVRFVMECYPMTLKQLIKGPLLPAACRRYTGHILAGIDFLHGSGIMHRDVKPDNLLIGTDENLKIADFGLAREVLDGERAYTRNLVTLWYRSREVLLGLLYLYDVDVWSIGCVVSEMATATALFAGKDEADMLRTHGDVVCDDLKTMSSKLRRRICADDSTWMNEVADFVALTFVPRANRPSAKTLSRHEFVTKGRG